MIRNALNKVRPDRRDYSLLHTLGSTAPDPKGLPAKFSIYDGRTIPNQELLDTRFDPPVRPLYYGCTGEAQTFARGLKSGKTYRPDDHYDHTYPFKEDTGRDMRKSMQTGIDRGYMDERGMLGDKDTAYFNCYGSGKIDDCDAARIAIWINQNEKRSVSVGSWWYPEFNELSKRHPVVPLPSFDTSEATLHNHLVTGWDTINGVECVEDISWQGEDYANHGVCYIPRAIYNALMAQPWTGAFTAASLAGKTPVSIGIQAQIDHLIYFIFDLFGFKPL